MTRLNGEEKILQKFISTWECQTLSQWKISRFFLSQNTQLLSFWKCDKGSKERGNFWVFTSRNKTQSSVYCLEGRAPETIKDPQSLPGKIPPISMGSRFLGKFQPQNPCPFSRSHFDIMRHSLRPSIIKLRYQRTCYHHSGLQSLSSRVFIFRKGKGFSSDVRN